MLLRIMRKHYITFCVIAYTINYLYMKAIRIYTLAAFMIASTTFADATPVLAEPAVAPFQSRPKPPPPPPDPLHLFSKKRTHRTRVVKRHRSSRLHVKLPPPPPAPPRPKLP
jgi:hypothetical protein